MDENKGMAINPTDGTNGETPTGTVPAKKPLGTRIQEAYYAFKATKGGRWTIRGVKAAGILTALGITADTAYKKGQADKEATIVYVTKVEPEAEEAPVEETEEKEIPVQNDAV